MNIVEKVARAIADEDGNDYHSSYNYLATAAINAFLVAAAEDGWHMRPDEATEEMDTAGHGWCWENGATKCWRDMGKAAPKFEWKEEE